MRTRGRARGRPRPEPKTERHEVSFADSATIAVVADTHSQPHADGLAHVRELAPDLILHAGDIGDDAVIDTLEAIAPTLVVRGNIDPRDRADHMRIALGSADTTWLTVFLTHIAVRGPRLMPSVADEARSHEASLVICGHSHVPLIARDRGMTVFNPGSIGPRRFALPITFGVLELDGERVRARHIDCETGQPWSPPG